MLIILIEKVTIGKVLNRMKNEIKFHRNMVLCNYYYTASPAKASILLL